MNDQPTSSFDILFVCRANQIRSVIAELLVAQALRQTGDALGIPGSSTPWTSKSAGVSASEGAQCPRRVQEVLSHWDIDASQKTSRQLTVSDVIEADLILTAERAHRSAVVSLEPKAVHRVFTIKQFGRLVEDGYPVEFTPQGGADLIEHARSRRNLSISSTSPDDDIRDPVGGSSRRLDACAQEIARSLAVFGVSTDPVGVKDRRSRIWSRRS